MKFNGKKLLIMGLTGIMAISMTACSQSTPDAGSNNESSAEHVHKIGVAVYSTDDDEVSMFRDYYKDYLENTFDVEFIYSDAISNIDEEKAFIDSAKEEDCEGIISYVSYNLPEIVDYCGDLYYTIGSTSFSQDDYNAVKGKENFLGIMSPSDDAEFNSGVDMIDALDENTGTEKTWVLLSGGASLGNYMHATRTKGMLSELQNKGYTLLATEEEIINSSESIVAAEHKDGGKVIVSPGYYMVEDFKEPVITSILKNNADIVASVCSLSSIYKDLDKIELSIGKDIMTATIDCFSNNNLEAFNNGKLNYVSGKCQAMAAPSFITMYNAITGYPEFTKENGEAYCLHQNFWTASNVDEYNEMIEKANNIYNNVYGSKDMMQVMKIYNENASFEDFKKFVEKLNDM